MKDTLYNMVEIFDGKISAEMNDATRGSILHDGWTKSDANFVAIFACYTKKVVTSSYSGSIEEPQIVFLA